MKTVVLTGATGFIGANLTRRLLKDGHSIHLLLRRDSPRWRIKDIASDIVLHEISLLERDSLQKTLNKIRPDWIFHLAAFGGSSWQVDRKKIIETNLLGTINLLDASMENGFEAFLNAGTSSEYGLKDHPPSETELLEPNSCYAIAKAGATNYCRHIGVTKKARTVTLRLYSAFGPFEQPKRLMPVLILKALKGVFPPLVDPEVSRDFVYVDDVTDAFVIAAEFDKVEPGSIFNIGTGIQTKMRDVVAFAKKHFCITATPQWNAMNSRAWDTNIWIANNKKALETLKWKPKFSFEEGMKKMTAWFLENVEIQRLYEELVNVPANSEF
ncbi:MAG: NAD-dependent epimerase/dehydratase family protein [Candidatus Riflebacteria bacterium]|nr:NAD-dependent epimerase/dehydratase family protein [Candidatus Riflebacteria bacterium]